MIRKLSWNSNKLQNLKPGRTSVLKLATHPLRKDLPCVEYHTITHVELRTCEERYRGRLDEDEEHEGGSQEVKEEDL